MGAINSPLLDISISGARGVLFAIAGGDDLTMNEVQDAAKTITESIDTDAKVIFGAVKDDRLKKSEIKVTVIATGFPETGKKSSPQVELIRSTPVNTAAPEKERREIHNILPQTAEKTPMLTPTSTPSPSSSKIVIEDDSLLESSTDDWNAVPAFLRRGKK